MFVDELGGLQRRLDVLHEVAVVDDRHLRVAETSERSCAGDDGGDEEDLASWRCAS